MSIWQAILLGLIQGLTEFIPISSTAHLTITGATLGLINKDDPAQWTAFIAVIQLGTLIAVIAYFRAEIIDIIRGFVLGNIALFKGNTTDQATRSNAALGWMVIAGSLPIGVVGLIFRDQIEGHLTKNLWVITTSVIGLAIPLALADLFGRRRRDMSELKLTDALAVGAAQVFSLIPGSSRSGVTITGALLVGLERETAARFSFLLSIPAIAASGLLELPKAFGSVGAGWTAVVVATVVSAISGYLSIAFLLRYLQKHTTFLFVGYRLALGAVLIWLLLSGRIEAQ